MFFQKSNLGPLKQNKLFSGIEESETKYSYNQKSILQFGEGDIIYVKGNEANTIYLVLSGEVKIKYSGDFAGQGIVQKRENQFFGVQEFLSKIKRSSSAIANTACTLYPLQRSDFEQLQKRVPKILTNLTIVDTEETEYTEKTSDILPKEGADTLKFKEPLFKKTTLVEPKSRPTLERELPTEKPIEEKKTDTAESTQLPEDEQLENITFDDLHLQTDHITDESIQEKYEQGEEDFLNTFNENLETESEEIKGETHLMEESVSRETGEHTDFPKWDFNLDKTEAKSDEETESGATDFLNTTSFNLEPIDDDTTGETSDTAKASGDSLSLEQMNLLIKAAQNVNSNLELDKVLKTITDAAKELTLADRGTLYIVDKEKNELWSKVAIGSETREIKLTIGEGIAGWVAKNAEIVNIPDVSVDSRFNPDFDRASGYQTKNMLCFPILNKEREVIGVLQLLNSKHGSFKPHPDETILRALSIHAALALENADLVSQLLRSEKLSSIGKMANFIIQDVKKPILTVKHYAEHIKKKSVPAEVKQVLDMLIEQVENVVDLVQTTLNYSEGKKLLRTQPLPLHQTLDEILELLAEYTISRKVQVLKKYQDNVIANLDKKELYQALFQITKNACDAMSDGGSIYVSTKVEGANVLISFKDQGLGIPDSIRERIFEPFMSHGKKNGTGLGLCITEKIVNDHGGTIIVESDLGEGANFIISLPFAQIIK